MKNNIPVVALIGKPNVGKSSIFNQIIKKRKTIVEPTAGVTRDRIYELVNIYEKPFYLIDSGGITIEDRDSFVDDIRLQTNISIEEADVIVFVVEVHSLTQDDYEIVDILRKRSIEPIIVVNKVDNDKLENYTYEFAQLGFDEMISVSAAHKKNIHTLVNIIQEKIPQNSFETNETDEIRISIIGKPNVGKSSLSNLLLNIDRSIVSDVAGTTRDSIEESILFDGKKLTFIDTAGIRRKNKVVENLEYYSVKRAMEAIKNSDVVLHLIDAVENISTQDKKIIEQAVNVHKAIIMVINKWDLVKNEKLIKEYKDWIKFKFGIASYIPILTISCVEKLRIKELLYEIIKIYKLYSLKIETNKLNSFIKKLLSETSLVGKGGRIKIYYSTQVESAPIKIVLFVNNIQYVNENFKRFLTNRIREEYNLTGVPIILKIKPHR